MHIEWSEFKEFRKEREKIQKEDKLYLLIDFIISFYNIHSLERIFEILKKDTLSLLMMKKRGIKSLEDLDKYIKLYGSKFQKIY